MDTLLKFSTAVNPDFAGRGTESGLNRRRPRAAPISSLPANVARSTLRPAPPPPTTAEVRPLCRCAPGGSRSTVLNLKVQYFSRLSANSTSFAAVRLAARGLNLDTRVYPATGYSTARYLNPVLERWITPVI
eukprot:SAG31_NODE_34_length_31842_cov_31.677850_27_plen_132_part_00